MYAILAAGLVILLVLLFFIGRAVGIARSRRRLPDHPAQMEPPQSPAEPESAPQPEPVPEPVPEPEPPAASEETPVPPVIVPESAPAEEAPAPEAVTPPEEEVPAEEPEAPVSEEVPAEPEPAPEPEPTPQTPEEAPEEPTSPRPWIATAWTPCWRRSAIWSPDLRQSKKPPFSLSENGGLFHDYANSMGVRVQTSRILACRRFRSWKVSGFLPGSRSRAAG